MIVEGTEEEKAAAAARLRRERIEQRETGSGEGDGGDSPGAGTGDVIQHRRTLLPRLSPSRGLPGSNAQGGGGGGRGSRQEIPSARSMGSGDTDRYTTVVKPRGSACGSGVCVVQ